MNIQKFENEDDSAFAEEEDMVLDNFIPPTKSRFQGRGASRKPRISAKPGGLRPGQLPICGYVQRNPTESNRPPSFCNRSSQYPMGVKTTTPHPPLPERHNSGIYGGRYQGVGKDYNRGAIQARYNPYMNKSAGQYLVKQESGDGGEMGTRSPYFSQTTRHPPHSQAQNAHFLDTQKEEMGQGRRGRASRWEKPNVHAQGAYISQVRDWIRHKDTLELLMDIYGYVDSDIATKEWGRKEFLLRDETGHIYVSYYEIDNPMIKAARRTWLKVSCVWRSWGLQAVAVFLPEENFMECLETKALNSKKLLQDKLREYDIPLF